MKFVIGAAAAAVLLAASPALAQTAATGNCSGFEAVPTLPDGATATRAQIEEANTAFTAWDSARQQRQLACRAEIEANSQAFNTAEAERRAAQTAWAAEVTEFNGRGDASNRRERGSTLTRPDHQ
jgi:hypothetical protein